LKTKKQKKEKDSENRRHEPVQPAI